MGSVTDHIEEVKWDWFRKGVPRWVVGGSGRPGGVIPGG
jgi:hypothetical protein